MTYRYERNRLTNATYAYGAQEAYTYDAAGNRTQRVIIAAATPADTIAPASPTNVAISNVEANQIALNWDRARDTGGSGLGGYYIFTNGVLCATSVNNSALIDISSGLPVLVSVAAFDRAMNTSAQTVPVSFVPTVPLVLFDAKTTTAALTFWVRGTVGRGFLVEASSNLVNWTLLQTNTISSSGFTGFSDAIIGNEARRFYRVHSLTNAPSTELIINGGFELPNVSVGTDVRFTPPSSALVGWSVGGSGGFVAVNNSNAVAAGGSNYASFNAGNNPNGTWIEQTFGTTAGSVYALNFQAGRTGGSAQGASVQVSAKSQADDVLGPFQIAVAGIEGFAPSQRRYFTATGPTTALRFLDTTPDSDGVDLLLDNVSVRSVTYQNSVFTDAFGRPDSPIVGNGWANTFGNAGGNLAIVGGQLSPPPVDGSAGIFRGMPFPGATRIQATIRQGSGCCGYRRYHHSFAIRNDGIWGHGYYLTVERGGTTTNYSQVILFENSTRLGVVDSPLLFDTELQFEALFREDGSVAGQILNTTNTFTFSFPPRVVHSNGTNFAVWCDMGTHPVRQRFDDISLQQSDLNGP